MPTSDEPSHDSSSKKQDIVILMTGLAGAGKTTLLFKLRLGEIVTSVPSAGFNVETVEYKNLKFTNWDVAQGDQFRPVWKRYLENANCLIFIVDSNDRERVGQARDELHKMLSEDELRNAALLVFANKQDLSNAMPTSEVQEKLGLNDLSERVWSVQGCTANTGDGLYEGLNWITTNIKNKANSKSDNQ